MDQAASALNQRVKSIFPAPLPLRRPSACTVVWLSVWLRLISARCRELSLNIDNPTVAHLLIRTLNCRRNLHAVTAHWHENPDELIIS